MNRPRCCECGEEADVHSYDDHAYYCKFHYQRHLIDKAIEDPDIGFIACPTCDDDLIIDWKNREVYTRDSFIEHLMDDADAKSEFSWMDDPDEE